MNTAEHT